MFFETVRIQKFIKYILDLALVWRLPKNKRKLRVFINPFWKPLLTIRIYRFELYIKVFKSRALWVIGACLQKYRWFSNCPPSRVTLGIIPCAYFIILQNEITARSNQQFIWIFRHKVHQFRHKLFSQKILERKAILKIDSEQQPTILFKVLSHSL